MAVSLTSRLGIHRWTDDNDPWDREDWDGDNAQLEAITIIGTQGAGSARPAPGVQRRLYLADDVERLYLDDGDEWLEVGLLATANTWTAAQTFDAGITATDGTLEVTGILDVSGVVKSGGVNLATTTALTDHINDTTAAHVAASIGNTPAGSIAATDVQAALNELDTEKAPKASPTFTGTLTHTGTLVGFYSATPVTRPGTYTTAGAADRTLAAYTSDPESSAYTGAADGEAKLADLNALRMAVENLRTYVEDLAGLSISTVTDLKSLGLFG